MKYALSFIAALFLLTGCTTFEDGPTFDFVAAQKRLANDWAVREAIIRNNDITANYASDVITFEELGNFSYLDAARTITSPPFTQSETLSALGNGTWNFLDGKNQIELLYRFVFKDLYDPNIVYEEEHYEQWEILRLTADELWLRGDSISLKLEPI